MPLSYLEELTNTFSPYLTGLELCQAIDEWFVEHPAARREAIARLRSMLLSMRNYNASDIDFGAPGCRKENWMRVYGTKKIMPNLESMTFLESTSIILAWLTPLQKKTLYEKKSVDFSVSLEEDEGVHRFRGSVYYDRLFPAANFRRINQKVLDISNLGFPKPIADRMDLRFEKCGLILVTGITGSGKSTTLDSIIDMNNRNNSAHITIIGHPIEFIHESKQCIVRHRDVGVDVESFQRGTIEALRQDPDIIIIGEMRDPLTIATVLEITDSGHKCFTTLHTSSAIDSIHRIVAEFAADEQDRIRNRLADVLSVCVSQKLVPTIEGKLMLAKEILSVDSSVQAAIRNQNIGEIYQMMVEGKKNGMTTLEQDLYEHYRNGLITNRTAMNFANNKKRMMQLLSTP
jgi:twitching motility protein PilT